MTSDPYGLCSNFTPNIINVRELIDFYSLYNHHKTVGSLMISGETEVNLFALNRLILKVKFVPDH